MQKVKQFKTYEEQVEILKKKGLIIDVDAIEVLKRNNYYFLINRYKDIFTIPDIKPSKFKNNVHFSEIIALYQFDRDLRSLILKYIILIENTLKSILSHEFSKKYNYDYLNQKNFIDNCDEIKTKAINSLFNSIKQTIKTGIKNNKYINYYHKNYSKIPLWVIINDLSLSLTVKFYNLLKIEDKEIISNYFNISSDNFYLYLQFIKYYRNLAAHNQRMFDAKNEFKISKTIYHSNLNLEQANDDIMALIIIFKSLLTNNDFEDFKVELQKLLKQFDNKVNAIDNKLVLNYMGLPINWHEI